jgi:hypothetical protein
VIRRHPVASKQREILDIGSHLRLRAEHFVLERDRPFAIARHTESQDERFPCGCPAIALLR